MDCCSMKNSLSGFVSTKLAKLWINVNVTLVLENWYGQNLLSVFASTKICVNQKRDEFNEIWIKRQEIYVSNELLEPNYWNCMWTELNRKALTRTKKIEPNALKQITTYKINEEVDSKWNGILNETESCLKQITHQV